MDSDVCTQISLAEFDDRTGHVYAPMTAFNVAKEHWAERRGILLGVVTLDQVDGDFGFVVLGRDERGRFRAIEVVCSYSSIDAARNALQAMMREIARSGATMFPQDCLQ